MTRMDNIAVIIPSLEPDQALIDLIRDIRRLEEAELTLIVVDDGSGADYQALFQQVETQFGAVVLTHPENYGKGRALKTAFRYILDHCPDVRGVVTIDSDGQHQYEDMARCVQKFNAYPDAIIFGSRDFIEEENIPVKSRLGNRLTSHLLEDMTGIEIQDTQTGLRVIGKLYLKDLLEVEGDRFEYEMNMIIFARDHQIEIIEVPIATIYHNDNEGSHFRVLTDSVLIYRVFLKYLTSSVIAFLVDILLFWLLVSFLGQVQFWAITLATVGSRVISSVTNYLLNRYWVFDNQGRHTEGKYFSLVILQMLASSLLVTLLSRTLRFSPTLTKVGVDAFLFLVSYLIQKKLIFNGGD